MIIDLHCHHTFTRLPITATERFSFESPGPEGTPTAFDSCLPDRVLNRPSWLLLRRCLRLPPPGPELDRELAAYYEEQLNEPGPVERCVILAFDAYHDNAGRIVPLPTSKHELGSDMYSSNSITRDLCRRHPGHYLFGASVHPYRDNAIACLDEVFAAGACLIKLMPLHQNINPADERTLRFFRHCAGLGLPLLLHYGPEFSLATQHRAYGEIPPLLDTLRILRRERTMPTTIIAHVATPVLPTGPWRQYRELVEALQGEFADAPLYADIAALLAWGKVFSLRKLARRQELHAKLLFGTDFPVPMATPWLRWRCGRRWVEISRYASCAQRSAAIVRHAGFNEVVLHRASEILPHVDFLAHSV
ncbi:MAG: amidohydrolase family protein [Phycisphaerae bacterium]|nr:amidohydrolase family protein [Phycisphaerae bacterium]